MPNSPDRISSCIYYAIGDVHGEIIRLSALHQAIFAHHRTHYSNSKQVIVHLGDYVDRGPDSCGVLQLLIALEAEFESAEDAQLINLRGNHEQQMLDALADIDGSAMQTWTREGWGGEKTLASYASREDGDELLIAHCAWTSQLPAIWCPQLDPLVFVHAGVDPDQYPNEDEEIYLWTRSRDFFDTRRWVNPSLMGMTIVHGHTPTRNDVPEINQTGSYRRVNVDTGAVYGGPLTCAVIDPASGDIEFLYA